MTYKYIAFFRETGMGAYEITHIYNTQGKELQPKSIRTKSGHHGKDVWILRDGIYYIKELQISNKGKQRERVRMVKIDKGRLYILREEVIQDDYLGILSPLPKWFPGTGGA